MWHEYLQYEAFVAEGLCKDPLTWYEGKEAEEKALVERVTEKVREAKGWWSDLVGESNATWLAVLIFWVLYCLICCCGIAICKRVCKSKFDAK